MKRVILVGMVGLAALLVACGDGDEGKAPISAIELVADEFVVGTKTQLRVIATRTDATQDELVDGIVFKSSDDSIASVDPAGLVTVHFGGPVSFTATVEDLTADLATRTTCNYPKFAPDIVYGRTMPPLSWPAKTPDGTSFTLDLADVHCDKEWRDQIDTLVVVLSAGWCGPCHEYMQQLSLVADELETHRTRILYVIGQDRDYEVSGIDYAYSYVENTANEVGGRVPGIVVGDLDTSPVSAFVQNSSHVLGWPTSFIIRLRDMKVIASANLIPKQSTNFRLDIARIADNPEGDWSMGNRGATFVDLCGSGDEEASEPNNTPWKAAPVTAGTFRGGICTDAPDFYQVELDGKWEFELTFDSAVGDLDVLVWDAEANTPLMVDGQVIGSTGSTGVERFEYSGRAVVGVYGYQHASAPYTLKITEK